jgi:hypothetical protein
MLRWIVGILFVRSIGIYILGVIIAYFGMLNIAGNSFIRFVGDWIVRIVDMIIIIIML